MNAYELADTLDDFFERKGFKENVYSPIIRQQADRIVELEKNLHMIQRHYDQLDTRPSKQLSDEEIRALWKPMPDTKVYVSDLYAFARAIIKEMNK